MLHVVQAAAWDWAPPHMSGYPHLPAPPTQYQQSYDEDPQWPSYPPRFARVTRYTCLDSGLPLEDSTPFSAFCRRLCE